MKKEIVLPFARQGLLAALLAALLVACGQVSASETGVPAIETKARVQVVGTKVSLAVPEGFRAVELYPGFEHPDLAASIMITEIPGPYEEIGAGMTESMLATRDLVLLSSEPARLASMEGLLLSVSQEAYGISFHKWIGIFGDSRETVMVVATYPEVFAPELSKPLKRAVLSVEWDREADVGLFDGLPYRIRESTLLKLSDRVGHALLLKGIDDPTLSPGERPVLVFGSSLGRLKIKDIEAYATSLFLQIERDLEFGDIKGEPVVIDGAPGYEITAEATEVETGNRLVVYQLFVLHRNVYYVATGSVAAALAEVYMDEFREVARSLTFVE